MWGSFWKRRWRQKREGNLGCGDVVGRKKEVKEKQKGRQHLALGPSEPRDLLQATAPQQVKAQPCRCLRAAEDGHAQGLGEWDLEGVSSEEWSRGQRREQEAGRRDEEETQR